MLYQDDAIMILLIPEQTAETLVGPVERRDTGTS
jgi:hypothetical protein